MLLTQYAKNNNIMYIKFDDNIVYYSDGEQEIIEVVYTEDNVLPYSNDIMGMYLREATNKTLEMNNKKVLNKIEEVILEIINNKKKTESKGDVLLVELNLLDLFMLRDGGKSARELNAFCKDNNQGIFNKIVLCDYYHNAMAKVL